IGRCGIFGIGPRTGFGGADGRADGVAEPDELDAAGRVPIGVLEGIVDAGRGAGADGVAAAAGGLAGIGCGGAGAGGRAAAGAGVDGTEIGGRAGSGGRGPVGTTATGGVGAGGATATGGAAAGFAATGAAGAATGGGAAVGRTTATGGGAATGGFGAGRAFGAVAFACFSVSAAASASASAWKCLRASSAWSRSRELECVFFSVTPISGRKSIRTFALISSSRASSLIRI